MLQVKASTQFFMNTIKDIQLSLKYFMQKLRESFLLHILIYLPEKNVKIGMFGEMKLIVMSFFKMAHNYGIGATRSRYPY